MAVRRREFVMATIAPTVAVCSSTLPQVKLGPFKVSRLIVGGNPVSGNSHVSGELSREMTDYFTAANVLKLLRECEQAGINTWQSRGDRHIRRLLHEYRLSGGRIQWIAQTASELASIPRNIRDLAAAGAIGIYHHGSQTDRFWAAGKIEQAREMLKVMRDAGVQVGLGTHIPEVVDYVESKGWDLDFYMTCVYNLSRPKQEAEKLAGKLVHDEFFWDPDRERMLERIRRTPKPCLIFKVYGASRQCASRKQMFEALRLVAGAAKPSDCVVIGMFPKYKEQVRENCRLVAEAFQST
jgi:hypothetical protein